MAAAIKGFIFDFNGVMVDDYTLQKQAWSEISQQLRSKPVTDNEMVHRIRGVPSRQTIFWMSNGSLPNGQIIEIANYKDSIIEGLIRSGSIFRLMDGIEEFLDECTALDITCGIVTSSSPPVFRLSFDHLKLARWFSWDQVLTNDGTYPGKPSPDPYIQGCKLIGLSPTECIVFEDAISGIKSAEAAGAAGIVVIGRNEKLKEFGKLPGVIKCINNFRNLHAKELTV